MITISSNGFRRPKKRNKRLKALAKFLCAVGYAGNSVNIGFYIGAMCIGSEEAIAMWKLCATLRGKCGDHGPYLLL